MGTDTDKKSRISGLPWESRRAEYSGTIYANSEPQPNAKHSCEASDTIER